MSRRALLLGALLITPLLGGVHSRPGPDPDALLDLQDHPPIIVAGDAMLRLGLAVGVRGGDGSPQNPYRIEGWYIDVANWTANGLRATSAAIDIRDTTAHVVIRLNAVVHAAPYGIQITNARNVRVERNYVETGTYTEAREVAGIVVAGGVDVTVADNRVRNIGAPNLAWTGIRVISGFATVVRDNEVTDEAGFTRSSTGFRIVGGVRPIVQDNRFATNPSARGPAVGFALADVSAPELKGNHAVGPDGARGVGFLLERTTGGAAAFNTARLFGSGLVLVRDAGTTVLGNELRNSLRGLVLESSYGGDVVAGNRMTSVARPFVVSGNATSAWLHVVAANNTADGRPVLYVQGAQGGSVDAGGATVAYVVNSRNVEIHNATVSGQAVGLTVVGSRAVVARDLALRGNDVAVRVFESLDTRLDRLAGGEVRVEGSFNVTVANATLVGTGYGVRFLKSTDGSRVERSHLEGNGIAVEIDNGHTNRVVGSVLRGNGYGVVLNAPAHAFVQGNAFEGNLAAGLVHKGSAATVSRADVSQNWWNSANGPTVAAVAGDRLVMESGVKTTWTPWLTARPAAVGPA